MNAKLSKKLLLASALMTMAFQAWADRSITDQLGRTVTIPDTVNRAVVLQHQTLDILVQLHANDQIVGVQETWKKDLGADFERFMPSLATMATPGGLTTVNIESLLGLNPDVVFVTNYAPQTMIDQIQNAGIPVVAISLREFKKGESSKLNPTLKDDEKTYMVGLKEGIELIGEVVNRTKEAKALNDWIFSHRDLVGKKLKAIPFEKRPTTYIANPNLATYGSGKFVNVLLDNAGAINVAAAKLKGYKQVTMEEVIDWNPEVIWVQHRHPKVVEDIKNDQNWSVISAVKNNRIYYMPEYAKAWGYPTPEAVGLGELWMAKKLYPDTFKDIDMDKLAQEYYSRFYRVNWTDGSKE